MTSEAQLRHIRELNSNPEHQSKAGKARAIMENRKQFIDTLKKIEKMEPDKPFDSIVRDMGLPENFETIEFDEGV